MLLLNIVGCPCAVGAKTPRGVRRLVFGSVVDCVYPDAVSVDVEPVAGRELAYRLARRTHVLAADRYESLGGLVARVVLRIRAPQRDLKRHGVIEERVVRGQA